MAAASGGIDPVSAIADGIKSVFDFYGTLVKSNSQDKTNQSSTINNAQANQLEYFQAYNIKWLSEKLLYHHKYETMNDCH